MKQLLVAALVALSLTACLPVEAQPPGYVASLSEGGTYICAGVAIAPQVVLTAEHCLSPDVLVDGKPAVLLAKDGNDHVLLKTEHVYQDHVRVGPSPKLGQSVTAWGHPAGFPLMFRRGYVAGTADVPLAALERVSSPVLTMYDMNVIGGDSGGPVLDSQGRVVATISMVYQQGPFSLMGSLPYTFTQDQIKHALESR